MTTRYAKLALGVVFMSALVTFSGCAMALKSPVTGFWYTGVTDGVAATPQVAVKRGEACATSILGLIATGDASIEAARKNGGINSIASVDGKSTGILGLYASYCTIVHGK